MQEYHDIAQFAKQTGNYTAHINGDAKAIVSIRKCYLLTNIDINIEMTKGESNKYL